MAAFNWTQGTHLPPPGTGSWVEKYRAALLETNPRHRPGRIAEAFHAIKNLAASADGTELDMNALLDAEEVLRSLQEHSASRAAHSPWLL